jgi:hypothetical protein
VRTAKLSNQKKWDIPSGPAHRRRSGGRTANRPTRKSGTSQRTCSAADLQADSEADQSEKAGLPSRPAPPQACKRTANPSNQKKRTFPADLPRRRRAGGQRIRPTRKRLRRGKSLKTVHTLRAVPSSYRIILAIAQDALLAAMSWYTCFRWI